jgi:ABC-2 type transport system permease protein
MRTILVVARKEIIQLRRDFRMLALILIMPVFQLVLLGYAANLDVKNVPLAVCDLDMSSSSRSLVSDFLNSDSYSLTARITDIRGVDKVILDGKAAIALVIPKGFGSFVKKGAPTTVELIADGSDSNTATIGLNHATLVVAWFSNKIITERLMLAGLGKPVRVEPEIRVWYNPNLISRNFMVPGILAMLLMMVTMLLTSMAIVKERETGTMEQLSVTPIKPIELIIGKLLPFIGIAFLDIGLVIVAGAIVFNVPIRGNIFLLFGLSGIYILSTLGLGLLISTFSKNQQQAMFSSTFFIMLPMIILSGFIFPIENMPFVIQLVTYLMPLRYFFVIVRGLFLKGVGMAALWDETLSLLILGIGIFIISSLRVRKRVK